MATSGLAVCGHFCRFVLSTKAPELRKICGKGHEQAWKKLYGEVLSFLFKHFYDIVLLLWFSCVFKIHSYWSTVALQRCVSFCCTTKWISYIYTYIPSFLDFLPIYVTTEHWVGLKFSIQLFFFFWSKDCRIFCINPHPCPAPPDWTSPGH